MKKLVALIILLVVSLAAFTACVTPEDKLAAKNGTVAAKEYVHALYRDKNVKTATDYTVVKQVPIEGVVYKVTWDLKVVNGDPTSVQLVVDEKGGYTVDIADKPICDTEYTLTATISDLVYGFTETLEYSFIVPEWKPMTYDEYVSAEDGAIVVVGGVINSILSKTLGDSTNGLYVNANDGKGGYYVYNMDTDPIDVYNVGDSIIVTGEKDIYNGTLEIVKAAVDVVSTGNEVVAKDITDAYINAADLKAEELVYGQAMLVTIKGVTVGGQTLSNGYYHFSLAGKESYVRISSSTCPLNKEDTDKFIAEHTAHKGWIANVTGVVCVYSGAFYLTPVTVDAFEYVSLPELSDADAVVFEKENFNPGLDSLYAKAQTIELPAVGQSYSKVAVAWASNSEFAVVNGSKLAITLPTEETEVTLTATFSCGDAATQTATYTFKVAPAKTINAVAPVVGAEYYFAMVQSNLNEVYYLTGVMDGYYGATTSSVDSAAKFLVEETTGGYHLYTVAGEAKTYVNMVASGTHVNIAFESAASTVYTYSDTYNTFVATVNGENYIFGTRSDKTYTTIGPVVANQKSPFYAQFVSTTNAPVEEDPLVVGQAYNFGMIQEKVSATSVYYLTGSMSGYYAGTTTNVASAAAVYVEKVDGGYNLYAMIGADKKYINMVVSGTHVNIAFEAAASTVYTYDKALETVVAVVNGENYIFGTRNDNTYTTVGPSKVSYDPFYCKFYAVEAHECEFATEWSSDATHHWHACVCGEVADKAEHDFSNGNCVCGKEKPADGPVEEENLTVERTNLFAGKTGTSYATYNGTYTLEGYSITTSDVLGNSHGVENVLQFKKETGILTISNISVKSITIVLVTSYAYSSCLSVKLAGNALTLPSVSEVSATGVKTGLKNSNGYEVSRYTIKIDLDAVVTGELVIANAATFAVYLESILVEAGATTEQPPVHECEFGAWQSNDEKHWKECACGEVAEEAAHDFSNGNCVCGKEAPATDDPVIEGGSADFNTIVTSNANGDSGYTKTYTTTDGWVVNYCAIQTGGASVLNPQFPVIGANNTFKAPCLNGKVSAPGSITSPTLTGGISVLKFSWTKMFTDTKIGALVTITEIATGNTQTYTLSWEGSKDEKYVVNNVEWTLDVVITGDFTIKFENTCPSANTGNKDRLTILSIEWVSAPAHECEFATEWSNDATHHWHACTCGEIADKAEHVAKYVIIDAESHKQVCNECGILVADVTAHDFTNGDCVCGQEAPAAEPVEKTAEITFGDKSKRTEFSSSKQVWKEGVITITNNKAASTSAVGDYYNPARFYASSELIIAIESGKILKIEITTTGGKNFSSSQAVTDAKLTASSTKTTIVPNGDTNSVTIAKLAAQVRISKIVITYVE